VWCRCKTSDGGYTWPNTSGQGQVMMVHGICRKPSRMVLEKETSMYAPRTATAVLGASGKQTGIHEVTFVTPAGKVVCLFYHPYVRKMGMENHPGRHLLLEIWQKLDEEVYGLKVADSPHTEYHKNRARAFAETLALLMAPFYPTADDVVREAVARWQARQAGESHDTPGLAEHLWDPMKNMDGSPRTVVGNGTATKSRTTKTKTQVGLQPQQEAFIRKALADKVMDAPSLAAMFKVDMSAIERLIG
jgi:Arc/MetJ-type ribon-helix-helix transcriptional regulator